MDATDFKTYWQGLKAPDREIFAKNVGSTVGYCHQIAYGDKRVELGLADAMVAHSAGMLALADLPLTARAVFQHAARCGTAAAAEPMTAEPKTAVTKQAA